ncbi:MAG: hypothetical protein KBB01_06065 [Candidatus Omnitrophica bacterium]|jgi:predicted membrane-bound spermidine synthase|nr:hypothetical protein [Candidatus Omnitrophota bacterium]
MLIFILLGIVSSIFQIVALREFSFSIAKHELSLLAGIGIWLLFGSLGSLTAKKRLIIPFGVLPLIFSLVFIFSILGSHLAKSLANIAYYEEVSLGFALGWGFILLGILSFFCGYGFSCFSRFYLDKNTYLAKTAVWFFIWEAIGFFIGGIIFTFSLSAYSNPLFFVLLPALFILAMEIKLSKKVISFLIIAILGLLSIFTFEKVLTKEFSGANILVKKGTPYGPIFLADSFGTLSLYQQGSLVASSADQSWYEEFIHGTFSSAEKIDKVLLIGPYTKGLLKEVLKYRLSRLDCVDKSVFFKDISQDLKPDNSINFVVADPRLYLKNTSLKYDCIIMNIPPPSNLSLNRFFTLEFFQIVESKLDKNGIFSFYIPSKRDILSPRILDFNSCILNTLGKAFSDYLFLPADTMIVLATNNKKITPEYLVENFSRSKIKTDYFTVYHLKEATDPSKIEYVKGMVNKEIKINSDFYPRGFLYYSLLEQAKFYPDLRVSFAKIGPVIIGFFILVFLASFYLSRLDKTWFIFFKVMMIGFSSIGITGIIFILFQVYCGALYWKIGILTGLFMVGLSSGAYLINLIALKIPFRRLTLYFYLGWLLFVGSFFLSMKLEGKFFAGYFLFYGYSLLTGILTGAVYPIVIPLLFDRKNPKNNIAALVYCADLLGAFVGTFFFSLFFIPFLGVKAGLFILLLVFLFLIISN